jgi:hypothetical protein
MKKILLSLIIIPVILSTAYALVGWLFPDTATFPRIPTGEGTVGKVIWTIVGTTDLTSVSIDGEVLNSRALSGVSSSGYLKNDINCPGTQKYIGIDADGKRLCGMSSTFLTDYGKIHSQDCPADYYRVDDTQGLTSTGDVLKAWDIVKTPPGCTMTIVFEDHSLLRLDGDTTISLDLGTFADGSTIASAILSNGSVWWRILTETWAYNVGTDVIVVWVRGTSIAITSTWNNITITNTGSGWGITRIPGPSQTLVNLVDSRISTGATVHCRNKVTNLIESLANLTIGGTYTISPLGCDLIKPVTVWVVKHQNFGNSWIRKNTRNDIKYMYELRSLSGIALSATKSKLIQDEIKITAPETTLTGVLTSTGLLESTNICEPGFKWWNERIWCQDISIKAIADFTRPLPGSGGSLAPLIFYGDPIKTLETLWAITIPDPGNWVYIGPSQYIEYNLAPLKSLLWWSLNMRTIIIETTGPVDPVKTTSLIFEVFFEQKQFYDLCSIMTVWLVAVGLVTLRIKVQAWPEISGTWRLLPETLRISVLDELV